MMQFPYGLCVWISQCTNERLQIYEREKKKKIIITNPYEIMSLLGCLCVMGFNRLSSINCYWSGKPSMGNTLLKSTFSRDRFKLLLSKLYMNKPEKPSSAGKLYYMEELIGCLKQTFQCRQDSSFQSIDESMTKFKGRSTLKQYLPMKPVKRGIKLWMRCDALTGYTYNMNVYTGKEDSPNPVGTPGERVVGALVSTIKETDVIFAFDRFFTSVKLMDTLQFGAVGTCNATKNFPKAAQRLEKGESEYKFKNKGTLLARWRHTKEVILLSNCHKKSSSPTQKKNKDGSGRWVSCP